MKLRPDVRRCHAFASQQHHGVKPQVGHLAGDLVLVVVFGGDDDFGGLFADLFRDAVDARCNELTDVGAVGVLANALKDRGPEIVRDLERRRS